MAQTRDDVPGASPYDTAGEGGLTGRPADRQTRYEQDSHEEPVLTSQDPARPGGRGSGLAVTLWAVAFLLFVAFFFYALGLGGR